MRSAIDEPERRVLLAADRSDWVGPVARRLGQLSVRVRVADRELQILDIVRAGGVDLALVGGDIQRIGGLQVVRRMHEIDRDLPVVVIGVRSDRHWLEEALRHGARTILPVPVSPARIFDMICRTLTVTVSQPGWSRGTWAN